MMPKLFALIGALAAAFAAYFAARSLSFGPRAARRLEAFAGEKETLANRVGSRLARMLGLDLNAWALHLQWIALEELRSPPPPTALLGQGLLWSLPGMGAAVLLGSPVFLAAPILLFALPFLRTRGRANRARRRVRREIPELATLIASELAAGNAPDRALERAAERPGPLARLLDMALAEAARTGRPLFSRGPTRGVLTDVLRRMGDEALNAFAVQLDMVAEKGAAGAELMGSIAEAMAREEQARAMRAAERLESDLVIPAALFFFLPFVAVVMLPLLISLSAAFR
ncbi:MAG: type II secretion system F family protein [Armatimonadota bacterium]|nr:type II secretion system F family protein [Armatimonadota bacterium]